ncbi:MAG: PAS domain-containing sensor histidine kinase [Halobacteria archaeon]|nr:PAS domain-containing sensor histidine kinase [Halobacteria archaeon]
MGRRKIDDYNEFFRKVLENIGVGVGVYSENGYIEYANRHYAEMLGLERDEILDKPIWELNPEVDPEKIDEYWGSFEEGETRVRQTVHERKDGSVFPVEVNTKCIRIGENVYHAGTIKDITQRVKNEERSEILSRVLRHDLKNRLTVIEGYVDLVRSSVDEEEIDPQIDEYLEKSKQEIARLDNKSRSTRKLQEVVKEDDTRYSVDLGRLLEKAVEKARKRFEKSGSSPSPDIRLSVSEDEDISIEVLTNGYLGQAVSQILDNAVIHNATENPVVDVTVEEENDSYVTISIDDNGPGIPYEERDLIFGREEKDDLHHGEGMGLFFVDEVVDSLNGEVWVEDSSLGGSSFKLQVPKHV